MDNKIIQEMIETCEELKDNIRKLCRGRINAGKCCENDCEFCPINSAYSMTSDYKEELDAENF